MSETKREWMIGHQGHTGLLTFDEIVVLIQGGQLRQEEMVKRSGQPWRAAREIPELAAYFRGEPAPPPAVTQPEAASAPTAGTEPQPEPEPPKAVPKPARMDRATRFRRLAAYKAGAEAKPPAPISTGDIPAINAEAAKLAAESSRGLPSVPPPEAEGVAEPPPGAAPDVPKQRTSARRWKPPAPPLSPMTPKYYSPAELVRDTAHAFEPLNLAVALGMLLPFFFVGGIFWSAGQYELKDTDRAGRAILETIALVIGGLGGLAAVVGLGVLTRRRLENAPTSFGESTRHIARNAVDMLLLAGVLLGAYLVGKGLLWVIGWVRDMSIPTAVILRILKVIPLLIAGLVVAIEAAGALMLVYCAAALAVEGCTGMGALKHVRSLMRDQPKRAALHAFIAATAVAGAWWLCGFLVDRAWGMPDATNSPDPAVATDWSSRRWWLFTAFYDCGLRWALTAFVPVSLASTLGVLSYVALRHPETAQLAPVTRPEETDQDEGGAPRPPLTPMEQTKPSETRPGGEEPAPGGGEGPPAAAPESSPGGETPVPSTEE